MRQGLEITCKVFNILNGDLRIDASIAELF